MYIYLYMFISKHVKLDSFNFPSAAIKRDCHARTRGSPPLHARARPSITSCVRTFCWGFLRVLYVALLLCIDIFFIFFSISHCILHIVRQYHPYFFNIVHRFLNILVLHSVLLNIRSLEFRGREDDGVFWHWILSVYSNKR